MGVFTINVLGLLNPRTFIVLQFCVIAYVEQLILSIGDRLRVCINQDDVRLKWRKTLQSLHMELFTVNVVRIAEGRHAKSHNGMNLSFDPQLAIEGFPVLLSG